MRAPIPTAPLALIGAVVATALVGCGGDDEPSPRANSQLPQGRKQVIFEPGPIYVTGPGRDQILDEIVGLGVDTVRLVVFWNEAAPEAEPPDPADPGYDFAAYDDFMSAAGQRDLKVLLTISGPAPIWATDGGTESSAPDSGMFGRFAAAVARRYSGGFDPDGDGGAPPLPAAWMWSVWNEPNLSIFLQPQYRNGEPYSPIFYRELYLAAQESIQAADPDARILVGETAPTGSTDSVDPIPFTEGVLCLDPIAARSPTCQEGQIEAAGWAAHPYGTIGQAPFEAPSSEDFVTIDSLANLESVLDSAAEAGTVASELPIYITEYGVQSRPDPVSGVPLQAQADYLSIAEGLAYADPRVKSHAQYLMLDDPPDRAPGTRFGGFESGLRFWDAAPKPSYDSFRLPLVVRRDGDRVSIWGLVRPSRGPTSVQVRIRDGGIVKPLRTLQTDDAGIFELQSDYRQGRLWQVRWTSPQGQPFAGPWTRSYSFGQDIGPP